MDSGGGVIAVQRVSARFTAEQRGIASADMATSKYVTSTSAVSTAAEGWDPYSDPEGRALVVGILAGIGYDPAHSYRAYPAPPRQASTAALLAERRPGPGPPGTAGSRGAAHSTKFRSQS